MKIENAQNALRFLQRVQLVGNEVPALVAVVRDLESHAAGLQPTPAELAEIQRQFDDAADRRDMPSGSA